MIQISNTYGVKNLFLNVFKNIESNSVSSTQFTHDSLHTRVNTSNYKLYITNELTNKLYTTFLTYKYENSRGAYFTFELGDGTGTTLKIDEVGTFKYEVYYMTSNNALSDKINVLDSGLFRIYNNLTFTDKYFDEDEQVIPTTIVYKG
tara:strand:+ start:53 stop:496 length:444 start_codon:yes stop_codon:yes gene_type:complete